MLNCPACGERNPLGGMFCRGCGAKLDLSGLTSGAVARASRKNLLVRYKGILIAIPVVALVLATVLSLWPQSTPLGENGTLVGARRVEGRLQTFREVAKGSRLGADPAFAEKDVNGYFQYVKSAKLRLASFSVRMTDQTIRLRIIRPLGGNLDVRKVRFSPLRSYDLLCVQMGSRLAVAKAWIGHLPVYGPLRTFVARRFLRLYSTEEEWRGLDHMSEIMLRDGVVGITVEN